VADQEPGFILGDQVDVKKIEKDAKTGKKGAQAHLPFKELD